MGKKLKNIPFYPFLLAIFPILSLLGNNIQEVDPRVALRSIAISLAVKMPSLQVTATDISPGALRFESGTFEGWTVENAGAWSIGKNPNGVWTYGYLPPGVLDPEDPFD